MRTPLKAAAVAAGVVLSLGLATPAFAAPGDNGNGACLKNVYGNATSPRDSGHGTLPSESPGPWVHNAPGAFFSVGDWMQMAGDYGVSGSDKIKVVCLFP